MKRTIRTALAVILLGSANTAFSQGWSWASKSSGTGLEHAYAIHNDASGNNYIAGTYSNGTAVFGPNTLTSTGISGDGFLAKTNSAGAFQWGVRIACPMSDYASCVATNGTSVFVAGIFRSTMTFFSTSATTATLTGVTTDDESYIARYDAAGNVVWAVAYTGVTGTHQKPRGIAINNTLSQIYVTGETGGKLFTNCYNFSGTLLWSNVSSNTGSALGWDVVSDGTATGNSYAIARYAAGPITLGTGTYTGTNGALLVKYDNAGVVQWVQNIGAAGGDEFPRAGLGIDAAGNLYVAGDFSGTANISGITLTNASGTTRDLFVAKYNNAGTVQWAQRAGGTGTETVLGISTDASGNSFISANQVENNSVSLDCQTFPAVVGNTDNKFFVVSYNNLGAVRWAGAPVANNNQTSAWGITTNGDGTAIVAGLTIGTTTFGATTLSSPTNADAFVSKIGSGVLTISGTTICSGFTSTLTPSAPTGSGYTFNWYAAATGGSPLFTGPSFTTPALFVTTTYYVAVTPGGCPGTRVPVTVTVNPRPTVGVTGTETLCPAFSGTLTASGATTYLWMPGNATGTTLSVSPLATTTYTVTGTNSFGCTDTEVFTVNTSPATNLVSNGNFSAGPTSAVGSSLPIETGNCTAGRYKVGPTFYNKCTSWPTTIFDHTSGTAAGYFLIIDNGPTAAQTVWSQKVPVVAGQNYTFSFWSNCIYNSTTYPVAIEMIVDGGVWAVTPAMGPTQQWRQYSCNYYAFTTGLVMLNLTVQSTSGAYRDFGIDDIFFGQCANDPIVVNNTSSSIACTYSVTATINAVNASGATTLLTSPAYSIAPGASQTYTFTPPAGYWLDYTTLSFATQTSTCAVNNFQLAYDVVQGNCWDCTIGPGNNNVTVWDNMGGNVFNIHADLVVGRMADPNAGNNVNDKTAPGTSEVTKVAAGNTYEIEIFPNPSTGMFTLNLPGENQKTIIVYDLMGKIVFERNTFDTTQLVDLTSQANGVYIVKVVSGNEIILNRVIKQ